MHRPSAFTLIELIVVMSVITLLAAVSVVGYNSQRAASRDANRKESLRAYQASLEQYRIARGTYFVYGSATKPPDSALVSDPITRKMKMSSTTDANAVGNVGGSWGGLNAVNSYNTVGSALTIASALQQQGFLARVQRDPSGTAAFSDYQLLLCQSGGTVPSQASNPTNSTEYSLVAKIEVASSDVTTSTTGICDGAYATSTLLKTDVTHTFAVFSRRW